MVSSYLTGCTQQVKYAGIFSTTTLEVTIGVPQGSNLGSLFFLIYVNNFKNCLNDSDSLMFADDTSIFLQNNDIKKLFDVGNKELQLVNQWLIANRSVVLKLCVTRDFQVRCIAFWNFGKYASISIRLNTM